MALQYVNGLLSYLIVIVCSLLMSLYGTNNPFQIGYSGSDSSVFIYVAKEILDGGMPYRDTFDHKGPLIYLIDALGLAINEQIGIWIIELITIFVIFLFTYKIARILRCSVFLSCFIVSIGVFFLSCYFQGGNLTEEYACAFIIISLYYFLNYFICGEVKKVELVLCGISFASVCMLRANMIALWIIMCIGVMVERICKHCEKDICKLLYWFLIGTAIVIIPILIWLIRNNAFNDFINDYLFFNFLYSSDVERVSFANIIEAIKFFIMGPPLVLTLPFLCYLCIKQNRFIDWLCMLTIVLSVVLSCISGQKYEHYGMIFYPLVIYALSRILYEIFLLKEDTTKKKVMKFFLLSSYVCLVFCYFLPFLFFFINIMKSTIFRHNGIFSNEKKVVSVIQSLTNEKDKITVVGNNNMFYLLSKRKSASKYSYQHPIAKVYPKIWGEYFADIRQLTARVVVLPTSARYNYPYKEILPTLNDNYTLVTVLPGNETYEIYILKKL